VPDPSVENMNEWNKDGSGIGSHVVYREIVANAEHKRMTLYVNLDKHSPFVLKFRPGDYYELH